MSKSRQEEAYEYVFGLFIKLLQQDKRISYEHKQSVIAFWQDLFAHEGVRNNMVQAFSNFLWELDEKLDASRRAGIVELSDNMLQVIRSKNNHVWKTDSVKAFIEGWTKHSLQIESTPEAELLTDEDIANADLSEVGGGDEDDTPLV